jgi:hypothetical protein
MGDIGAQGVSASWQRPRPEVMDGIRTNQDFKKLQEAEAFKYLSTDPLLNVGTEFEAGVRERLFAAPRRAAGLS